MRKGKRVTYNKVMFISSDLKYAKSNYNWGRGLTKWVKRQWAKMQRKQDWKDHND